MENGFYDGSSILFNDHVKSWVYVLGGYLGYMPQYQLPVNMSVVDYKVDTANFVGRRNHKVISNTVFYKYYLEKKEEQHDISIEKCQIDFIKNFELGYIIATPKARISKDILAITEKMIVDENNGERFIVLKQ